jgi:hypothetical protein
MAFVCIQIAKFNLTRLTVVNDKFYSLERMSAPRHPLRDRILHRIRRGELGTVREIMVVSNLPRQTVNRWLREEKIDLGRMRLRRLTMMYEQESRYLAGRPAKRKPSKAVLHRIAARWKRRWDRQNAARLEGIPPAGG